VHKNIYTSFTKEKTDTIKMQLDGIENYVVLHEKDLLKLFPLDEVEYIKRDIRLLQQCLDEDGEITNNHIITRDKFMAENIEWILDHEGKDSKMLIWAHNRHISKHDMWMGRYLKKKYGDEYYAIGFDFNKGTFKAGDLKNPGIKKDFTVNYTAKGTSGQVFSELNMPVFFIDIEKAVKTGTPSKVFFKEKITQRSIPAGFNTDKENEFFLSDALYHEYDGLIFVNNTTATHLEK
jgi:erythromycin esterase